MCLSNPDACYCDEAWRDGEGLPDPADGTMEGGEPEDEAIWQERMDLGREYSQRRREAREQGFDPNTHEGCAFMRWDE